MTNVQTIEHLGAFEALREDWADLLSDSPSDCLFLTWEWLFTWWKHLAGPRTLAILAVRCDGKLVGLAPLALAPRSMTHLWSLRTLQFLGSGGVGSDYLDIIIRRGHDATVVDALASHIAGRSLVVGLTQMDMRNGSAWGLSRELAARGWGVSRAATEVCPYIDLRALDWAAYLEQRSAAVRYNFRRRLRNLERLGPVSFERADTDDKRRDELQQLIAFHLERRKHLGGSEAFHRPEYLAFHDEFSRLALARGWLRLFTLRIGRAPVASLYCLRYRRAVLFYQSGFDERYAKQSVGLVAMGLAIKAAIEEGAEEYDLLHGDETYKFHWAAATRPIGRLEMYPAHALGRLCRRAVELKRTARRVARHLVSGPSADHVASVS